MLNAIIDNTRFLVIETENQVKLTYALLNKFDPDLLEKIDSKDDYIDNLKTIIENLCFSRIHGSEPVTQTEINDIRALHVICVNLERMADYCVNIARQTHYLSDPFFPHQYDYQSMFREIQWGISLIIPTYTKRDLSGALKICRTEYNLDKLYKHIFDKILNKLRSGKEIENLITTNSIYRYLERIGDSILNTGEALIFSIIGDRIKIRQFKALEKTLSQSGFNGDLNDIDFTTIWGSRSGCRISRVGEKRSSDYKAQGIFKEGHIKKVKKERENIIQWNKIYPGLAPRIFGYYEKGDNASMLVEFLPGCTLDQIILTHNEEMMRNVIFVFEQTVNEIWELTLREGQCRTDYMKQLKARLDSVKRMHHSFFRAGFAIEGLKIHETHELIGICQEIENQLPAPFTIFIHGDFNANNIVYNQEKQKVNYIDLHRSKQFDYIQDASVFLVSNFRIPAFETQMRNRLNEVIRHFYQTFAHFAQKHNDHTFEIRMSLALARSFITSSRFEVNQAFAKTMFLRGQYLLEKIANFKGNDWQNFKAHENILDY